MTTGTSGVDCPLAIIGMSCRFPGGANSPAAFWKMLVNKVDAITDVPPARWNPESYYHPNRSLPGKTYSRRGGFLERIDLFDPEFFGISPREAVCVSPQQRMLLELAWEAMEDAGLVPEKLAGSRTGVFVGISTDEYGEAQLNNYLTNVDAYTMLGSALSIAANRISYVFDFHGPSFVVDTACSSSLVALHCGCQSIWHGESDLVLVGGVNLLLGPERFIGFSRASMLSPDGLCRSFDAGANGYVRSEGGGIVILKPLAQALADHDPVYAVILATRLNQDGRTTGLALPNGEAQEALLREVYAQVGIAPQSVQYIEAHGTGTLAGDPIEATAVGRVIGQGRPPGDYCRIGSVKTNIGHLEPGSAIAGLIKLALSLKHGQIPASLHFDTPNPKIDFEGLRLKVQTEIGPWPRDHEDAVAGINSFSFGGANAHAVLKGVRAAHQPAVPAEPDRPCILPISTRSAQALEPLAQSYRSLLMGDPGMSLPDLCYSAGTRRGHHEHRVAVVARSVEDMIDRLGSFLAGKGDRNIATGRRLGDRGPKVAFVFSGNGPQWWGMARQLLEKEPVFRQVVDTCDRLLSRYASWSLLDELKAEEKQSRMDRTEIAQPALFAVQVGLLALWRSWGIESDAVLGHSVGEIAAAYAAGILNLEDAVKVIFHRSRTQEATAGKGKMVAVELGAQQAEQAVAEYRGRLAVAAFNAPTSVTLSGDADALEELLPALEKREVYCRYLRLNYAFHCHHMDPVREDLLSSLTGLQPRAGTVRFVSTVTGADAQSTEFGPDYWWANIRKPVRFAQAIDRLLEDDFTVFLEIGPHPVLASYIAESASTRNQTGTVMPSLRRNDDDRSVLLGSLGGLYAAGHAVDWSKLYPQGGRFISLPLYPWQGERYWLKEGRQPRLKGKPVHPLMGQRMESAHPQWQNTLDLRALTTLEDHRIENAVLFPITASVEVGLAAAMQVFGEVPCGLEDVELLAPLVLSVPQPPEVQTHVRPDHWLGIYSGDGGNDEWRLFFRAHLFPLPQPIPVRRLCLADSRERCGRTLSREDHYRITSRRNYHYGPLFQGVARVWCGDGEALAEVRLPEALAGEINQYKFHPALLDACGQVMIPVLPGWDDPNERTSWLPVKLDRYNFYSVPGQHLFAHVRIRKGGAGWLAVDLTVTDPEGIVVAEFLGFRWQAIDFTGRGQRPGVTDLFYEFRWQSRPRALAPSPHRHADYLPGPADLAEGLRAQAEQFGGDGQLGRYYDDLEPQLRRLCSAYCLRAFRQLGWDLSPGERISAAGAVRRLGLPDHQKRLVHRLLQVLEDGVLTRVGDEWEVRQAPRAANPDELWKRLAIEYPAYHAELLLLGRGGTRLADVLAGKVDAEQVLFAEKSATAEHLEDSSPTARPYHRLLREVVAQIVRALPADRTIRVLEIGANFGGAASHLLDALPPARTEYVVTEVSNARLSRAEQKLRKYSFVKCLLHNIEQDPAAQGLEENSFDLVVASNGLHAAQDLRLALTNVQRLLASQGLFALLERGPRPGWPDLVFGLLKEWWHFTDPERHTHPLLAADRWVELLEEAGFKEAVSLSDRPTGEPVRSLILARGRRVEAEQQETAPAAKRPAGTWLVFSDDQGMGHELAKRLRASGQRTILVKHGDRLEQLSEDEFRLNPRQPEDLPKIITAGRAGEVPVKGIVHFWSLDARPVSETSPATLEQAQDLGSLHVVHLVQALKKTTWTESPRLWLVTRGAQALQPGAEPMAIAQAPLWGLGRVVLNEHPDLRCTLVDLSPTPETLTSEVQDLVEELFADDREEELLFRAGNRYLNRMVHAPVGHQGRFRAQQELGENESFRLEIPRPGVLDNLMLQAVPRQEPGPGEVEIAVHAAGLNFKDVLQAQGIIAGEALEQGYAGGLSLGLECAGKVTRIGKGVEDLGVGDDVVAFGRHCLGRYVTTVAKLVAHKPAHLGFEEAATIPATFFTAYYALHEVGRLRRGERVLIHGAAGGVGLAAVQIVQQAGGEVFATAGSQEKRDFLRALGVAHVLDSRTLAFADEIMAITRGEGVHAVLNSLAGEAIPKSLKVLRPFGRFLEIGKRDFLENNQLALRPFEKCLSFHAIDVDQLMLNDPDLSQAVFRKLMTYFNQKVYHPLPFRVFPIQQAEDAFRHMQQSRHIGKIVMSVRGEDVPVRAREPEAYRFSGDASYLVAGGLSGFGLATARWMVENGARHVVLIGRRGADTPEATAGLEALHAAGAQVMVRKVDITDEDQVAGLVAEVRRALPPLRGVVHSAMVVDDAILLNVNREQFRRVVNPKMLGAWNLHRHTADLPLDFFVSYSSAVSMLGNAGQGSYAAANSFLDMMPAFRRRQGLAGLTVNWGALAGVGWLARNTEIGERVVSQWGRALPVDQALEALGRLLGERRTQVGVVDLDWKQGAKLGLLQGLPSRFVNLVREEGADQAQDQAGDFRSTVLAAAPAERCQIIQSHLCNHLAGVLRTFPSKLDLNKPITAQGLDSLMAVELQVRIQREMGVTLPVMNLLHRQTVADLAGIVFDRLGLNGQSSNSRGEGEAVTASPDGQDEVTLHEPVQAGGS
jgi:acyl transferase domain-containing protein/acyl carrier protein